MMDQDQQYPSPAHGHYNSFTNQYWCNICKLWLHAEKLAKSGHEHLGYPLVAMALKDAYTNPLLNKREVTHGRYLEATVFIQDLKARIHSHSKWTSLHAAQRESLDMICTKIGRIMHGTSNAIDHWEDIAGYANLISDMLQRSCDELSQSK